MAKGTKKRKNISAISHEVAKKFKQDAPSSNIAPEGAALIGGSIYVDELETTTETLVLLSKNPNLIGLKALKSFRTAVHDYWRVANETSLTGVWSVSKSNQIHMAQ